MVIETKNNCTMEVNKTFGTYWFRNINTFGVYENKFRISIIGNYRLIVLRVAFLNKKKDHDRVIERASGFLPGKRNWRNCNPISRNL